MAEKRTDIGGGYYLVRDPYCCWVIREITTKNGTKREKRVSGYCADIQDALTSLYVHHTREIDARSIKVLINEIKALKTAVTRWAEAIEGGQNGQDINSKDTT